MKNYNNWSHWKILRYEYNDDYITIEFWSGTWRVYRYTYNSAWATSIEEMKKLADKWNWLHTYIRKYEPLYLSKQ